MVQLEKVARNYKQFKSIEVFNVVIALVQRHDDSGEAVSVD
jgi:hypothetical protein